jgi:predicted MFS family arabinose efflux permease
MKTSLFAIRGDAKKALLLQIVAATVCRTLLNTARRFAYPFAPALSRGMDVPLTAVTTIIAANQATGLIGIFFGPMADRFGYRRMMLTGLGLMAVGMTAAGVVPFYGIVLVGLLMAGLGKSAFDPAIQAYVSEQVPFYRRGLAIGAMEFAWAGSTLLGIPLLAVLIDTAGWRSPFFFLGILALLGFSSIALLIPKTVDHRKTSGLHSSLWASFGLLLTKRPALGVMLASLLANAANDAIFVVYGAWLEEGFGMGILGLGAATGVIGAAELGGEVFSAAFGDRIGLKRAVIFGMGLAVAAYALLPFTAGSLPLALSGLFGLFLVYEFAIVGSISLATELLPEHRATMMAGFFAAAGIGRIIGAFSGGFIWTVARIEGTVLFSCLLGALGIAALVWGLRGWEGAKQGA